MKDGTSLSKIEDPTISIDRGSSSWAVFEHDFKLVHGFINFTDENEGLAAAKAFVATRSSEEPRVVYPCVRKFSMR